MNRNVCFFVLAALGLTIARSVPAAIIHESAILGTTGHTGGVSIFDLQWLGSRFSVDSFINVESVGGHIVGTELVGVSNKMFAAIVSLSSPTALPSGSPFDMTELVATAVFDPPTRSDDIRVPLSATLRPGHYALIFGVGLFGGGSSIGGGMPQSNIDIPGSASYISFSLLATWYDLPQMSNIRFVVTGTVIPEPSNIALVGLGVLGACGLYRRR